ncbi:MAG: N-acetylmuramoyl-L-alanine amidase [Opitutales bacterium]|nr:N-acetylmuramoyl-L-alanine amidase [Opitutales bacterium]
MPACLVEVGFVSNRAECSRLANKSYRQSVANAIARGVVRYASVVRRCKK